MMFDFDTDRPVFARNYEDLGNGLGRVEIGHIQVKVPHHPFWVKFAAGHEPETERVYRKLVHEGSIVLDIGAWIGSTILFGLACDAEKIIALEPNPQSFAAIESMLALNPELQQKVLVHEKAVSSCQQVLSMGMVEGETDTSTSGLGGNDFEVQATTIPRLLEGLDIGRIDLIKIDIEGAEVLLSDALAELGKIHRRNIHLSIHVPFFPEYGDTQRFIDSLREFQVYDDRGDKLDHDEFRHRILSTEPNPMWGTRHGNFFEVVLIPG